MWRISKQPHRHKEQIGGLSYARRWQEGVRVHEMGEGGPKVQTLL